jgi:hypothetical protein
LWTDTKHTTRLEKKTTDTPRTTPLKKITDTSQTIPLKKITDTPQTIPLKKTTDTQPSGMFCVSPQ